MSAQCVLLDRARHMPPPARESYIHRISRDGSRADASPDIFFLFLPGSRQ